jgi:hypothetical protein
MVIKSPTNADSLHRDGHTFGDRGKRTSIGEGRRKRGSYKGSKKYRGQGRR